MRALDYGRCAYYALSQGVAGLSRVQYIQCCSLETPNPQPWGVAGTLRFMVKPLGPLSQHGSLRGERA